MEKDKLNELENITNSEIEESPIKKRKPFKNKKRKKKIFNQISETKDLTLTESTTPSTFWKTREKNYLDEILETEKRERVEEIKEAETKLEEELKVNEEYETLKKNYHNSLKRITSLKIFTILTVVFFILIYIIGLFVLKDIAKKYDTVLKNLSTSYETLEKEYSTLNKDLASSYSVIDNLQKDNSTMKSLVEELQKDQAKLSFVKSYLCTPETNTSTSTSTSNEVSKEKIKEKILEGLNIIPSTEKVEKVQWGDYDLEALKELKKNWHPDLQNINLDAIQLPVQ